MEEEWDLNAVVRGYTALTTTHTIQSLAEFQNPVAPSPERSVQELHDLYKPYFPNSRTPSQVLLSSSVSLFPDLKSEHLPLRQTPQLFSVSNSAASHNPNPNPRSNRRKNHLKKVCHVSAENLSSDVWSWRKYGQKPIKGSPYPRGYYRCSTSKGCLARKQVERSRSDPGMFVVTYTAEHNHPAPAHRNSLAGSTRQKPSSEEQSRPEEDDEFSVSDDLFAGLGDLTTGPEGEGDSAHFPAGVEFPWLWNSATTTAGGG